MYLQLEMKQNTTTLL